MKRSKAPPTNYIRLIFICVLFVADILLLGLLISVCSIPPVVEVTSDATNTLPPIPDYTPTVIVTTAPETPIPKYEWIEFKVTAYCPCKKCCGEWAYKRPLDENGNVIVYGATGIVLKQGVSVAADTSIYPMGTELEIEGMGTYTVHDRGGAIKNNRLDIYFNTHADALDFGVRTVRVRVIK